MIKTACSKTIKHPTGIHTASSNLVDVPPPSWVCALGGAAGKRKKKVISLRDVTRPQSHEAEAEAEATTHEAEAEAEATTHEAEAEATTHEAEAEAEAKTHYRDSYYYYRI